MPSRVRNYAEEYRRRAERSRAYGISYARARVLRATFKLSPQAKRAVARAYGKDNVTEQHTLYAITRAHIARAQASRGETLTRRKQRAAATLSAVPVMANPVLALGNWYQAVGMDPGSLPTSRTMLPPRALGPTEGGGGGGGGGGGDFLPPERGLPPREMQTVEGFEYYEEDMYDWYDDIVDDFEAFDYGEYPG